MACGGGGGGGGRGDAKPGAAQGRALSLTLVASGFAAIPGPPFGTIECSREVAQREAVSEGVAPGALGHFISQDPTFRVADRSGGDEGAAPSLASCGTVGCQLAVRLQDSVGVDSHVAGERADWGQ